jgi:hypothetical protein
LVAFTLPDVFGLGTFVFIAKIAYSPFFVEKRGKKRKKKEKKKKKEKRNGEKKVWRAGKKKKKGIKGKGIIFL